jgi:hypothetical protein
LFLLGLESQNFVAAALSVGIVVEGIVVEGIVVVDIVVEGIVVEGIVVEGIVVVDIVVDIAGVVVGMFPTFGEKLEIVPADQPGHHNFDR